MNIRTSEIHSHTLNEFHGKCILINFSFKMCEGSNIKEVKIKVEFNLIVNRNEKNGFYCRDCDYTSKNVTKNGVFEAISARCPLN